MPPAPSFPQLAVPHCRPLPQGRPPRSQKASPCLSIACTPASADTLPQARPGRNILHCPASPDALFPRRKGEHPSAPPVFLEGSFLPCSHGTSAPVSEKIKLSNQTIFGCFRFPSFKTRCYNKVQPFPHSPFSLDSICQHITINELICFS